MSLFHGNILCRVVFPLLTLSACHVSAPAADVFVMPEQYSLVVKEYGQGDLSKFGPINKWNNIVLWGKCSDEFYNSRIKGRSCSYRWDYGNGNYSNWISIHAGNYKNLSTLTPYYGYPTPLASGYGMDFYAARLYVRDNAGPVILSSASLNVIVANFAAQTDGTDVFTKDDKRKFVESIAKGRGLKWLYDNQSAVGSWNAEAISDQTTGACYVYPISGTAMVLSAFLVNAHTVYDPGGLKDAFVYSVNNGFRYLLSRAQVMNVQSLGGYPTWGSDINSNGKMIAFTADISDPTKRDMYVHGIAMLALGASKNSVNKDAAYPCPYPVGGYTDYKYSDVLKDAVDYAAWAMTDPEGPDSKLDHDGVDGLRAGDQRNKYGWRYVANNTETLEAAGPGTGSYFDVDLSVTQWPVLGLSAIEDNWKDAGAAPFKAPGFVRKNLLTMVRRMQNQHNFNDSHLIDSAQRGGAMYWLFHKEVKLYDTHTPYYFMDEADIAYAGSDLTDTWHVGTNSLLQVMHYLSMDTDSSLEACQCGAGNCGDPKTDFTISLNSGFGNTMDTAKTCKRVRGATELIGKYWKPVPFSNATWSPGRPDFYTMYGDMKALRLYGYEKSGSGLNVNNGVIGGTHQWEEEFSYGILKIQSADGSWQSNWSPSTTRGKILGTAWAVLTLSEDVYGIKNIKTELFNNGLIKEARLRPADAEN